MFKKRKNHSMRRKKKLKQVVSDLRRRGGAYTISWGVDSGGPASPHHQHILIM